jgi:tetratricopeptide (TPR) repeat protein
VNDSTITESAWNNPRRAAVLLLLLGLLAYCNAFFKPFQLDDFMYFPGLDYVNNFIEAYTNLNNRPVIAVSILVNQFLGRSIVGFHALNVGVHLLTGLALFGLVRRTLSLERWAGRFTTSATPLAFVIAALWVVHPLNTSAVTYLIQRCESMMGLCYVTCFYTLVRGACSPHPWSWYVPGVLVGVLGSGCKETMLTAPFLLLLYDRTFLASSWGEVLRRRGLAHAGYFLILVFPLSIRIPGVLADDPNASTGFVVHGIQWYQYLMTQPGVLLHYLRLAVFPLGPTTESSLGLILSFDYRDWRIVTNWRDALWTALPILALLAITIYGAMRARWWGFLGAWFFGVLSLTSSIFALLDVCCEYRMYLPLMAVLTFLVLTAHHLGQTLPAVLRRAGAFFIPFVLIAGLTTLTLVRNDEYHSGESLWGKVLEVRPRNLKAYVHIAESYQREEKWEEAEKYQELAFKELRPNFPVLYNLGSILTRKDQTARGLLLVEASMGYPSANVRPLCLLGRFQHVLGPTVHPTLGPSTLGLLGSPLAGGPLPAATALSCYSELAQAYLERAVAKSPRFAMCHFHLATVLADRYPDDPIQQQRVREHLAIGQALEPKWAEGMRREANLRLRKGMFDTRAVYLEALFLAKEANLAAGNRDPDLLFTLGWAYETLGNNNEAQAAYRRAFTRAEETNHPILSRVREKLVKE